MSNARKQTEFDTLLHDLNGGVFLQQLNAAITDVSSNVVAHGKAGSVSIDLSIKRIGDTMQVNVQHKITASVPKPRGKITEENTTETPLHCDAGRLTLFPDVQSKMDLGAGAATGRTDVGPGRRSPA